MEKEILELRKVLKEYNELGIRNQIDYQKFYLYSIITHSTAIEGSTVTEIENLLMFDEGISAKGRPMVEQLMNLDLKRAYEQSMKWAEEHKPFSIDMLKAISALVMRNTGSHYSTLMGEFDSSKGDLRLVSVTAGAGGRSYMNYKKLPTKLEEFCKLMNERRKKRERDFNPIDAYLLSVDAHNILVAIHPWVDGNGRMSRLIMNHIQFEFGLVPTKVMQEDKADYIEALNISREEESMQPFRMFMLKEHTKNIKCEISEYKKSMENDFPFNTCMVDQKGGPETKAALLQLISDNNSITTREMAEKTGINRSAISKHLRKLQDDNIIRREGSQKSGKWVIIRHDTDTHNLQ